MHRGRSRLPAVLAVLVLGLLAATSSAASGEGATPAPIPPTSLELHTGELPGFAGARKTLEVSESADQFIESRAGSPTEQEAALRLLASRGFQDTVSELFRAPHREAVFTAIVFTSSQGATEWLQESLAAASKHFKGHGAKRSTVKGIPGSVLIGQFEKGHRGGTGNVFFAAGRCFFVVGDAVKRATSRAEAYRAPIAAAKAVLRRQSSACG